jgi:hypothetical protein
MSTIVKFFTALDDKAAATVLDCGPDRDREVLTVGNFDAASAVVEWDGILTGRTAGEPGRGDVPRIVAGDEGPFIFAASGNLQHALTAATPDELASAARRWIEQEDLDGYDPELFTDILSELAALARSADRHGQALYCWMC